MLREKDEALSVANLKLTQMQHEIAQIAYLGNLGFKKEMNDMKSRMTTKFHEEIFIITRKIEGALQKRQQENFLTSCLMIASKLSEDQLKKIQDVVNLLNIKNEALLEANDKLVQMRKDIVNVGNPGWTPIGFSFNIEIENLKIALSKGAQEKLKVIKKQDQDIIEAKAQDVQKNAKYAAEKKDDIRCKE